jgi:molybdenum cofactor biosynthesis protein B
MSAPPSIRPAGGEGSHLPTRVLVAAVTQSRSGIVESLAKAVTEEVLQRSLTLVRNVVVNGERQYIQQLVSNVSNANEADAIIMVGGVGIGPRDETCEAIDAFVERHLEGFGDAFRRMLLAEIGVHSLLARATAGVYNRCLVFAMSGREADVRRAMVELVLPTLPKAVELATGHRRPGEIRA